MSISVPCLPPWSVLLLNVFLQFPPLFGKLCLFWIARTVFTGNRVMFKPIADTGCGKLGPVQRGRAITWAWVQGMRPILRICLLCLPPHSGGVLINNQGLRQPAAVFPGKQEQTKSWVWVLLCCVALWVSWCPLLLPHSPCYGVNLVLKLKTAFDRIVTNFVEVWTISTKNVLASFPLRASAFDGNGQCMVEGDELSLFISYSTLKDVQPLHWFTLHF